MRTGMLEARGAWRLFSDADLSTPIEADCALAIITGDSDEGVEIPMSGGSLNNQLRQAERFCAKLGCDLEGG